MKNRMFSRLVLVGVSTIILSGCLARPEPLEPKFQEIYKVARKKVQPIPRVPPYKALVYKGSLLRSPFKLPSPEFRASLAGRGNDCWQPQLGDSSSPLQRFAIETMSLQGILTDPLGSELWALVATPDGQVLSVSVGEYIGSNYGRVSAIDELQIEVNEKVADGFGCWKPRKITMALPQAEVTQG
ncbi:hypothetical protein VST7929_02536 [Vibrio stylophorae]|uniref:Pilus assembly protein PilP n=1 Tax=Vibrio stylophorae TaxID=659351 RepID=A0ABN8DX23_9VIBR|nr:pilus assembly protein PilP [Vibrio stylophorae]CAH0534592.1 hypothetical protein VST7929_02536 [Vibrio stylophorae]